MQICGPSQAGPSLEPRWLSQTRSHLLLEDDTNSSYLYWKDLPGRGEPDTEGAWRAGRRGRQLPAPRAFLPAPAPPSPLRDWSHWEVTGWEGTQLQVVQDEGPSRGVPWEPSPVGCAGRCPRSHLGHLKVSLSLG